MNERIRITHFTPIGNLISILRSGRILCKSQLGGTHTAYADIASQDIQRKRARQHVPCGPRGTLPEYVPFFFASRSPMLYYIWKHVDIYPEGQEPLVYLVSYAQDVQAAGLPFVFTDGHPIMALSNFYDNLADLDKIHWSVMRAKMWNDTPEYPDRQRRREAEFLIHRYCPWELIVGIVVKSERMRERVEEVLEFTDHKPPVAIRSNWYYP